MFKPETPEERIALGAFYGSFAISAAATGYGVFAFPPGKAWPVWILVLSLSWGIYGVLLFAYIGVSEIFMGVRGVIKW